MIKNKFDPVLETLNNFHDWSFLMYVLELRLNDPGVKTLEWDPISQIRINMVFGNIYSTQVGLVLNLMNG